MTLSPERIAIAERVCCGNKEAANFVLWFVEWCHWIDDLVDRDKVWSPRDTVRVNLEAMLSFSCNPFFQDHKKNLMPMIVSAFAAFADSNTWATRENVRDRRASDILKSYYHEVIWQVAYLCGGWEHMRAVTAERRIFDYDIKD